MIYISYINTVDNHFGDIIAFTYPNIYSYVYIDHI